MNSLYKTTEILKKRSGFMNQQSKLNSSSDLEFEDARIKNDKRKIWALFKKHTPEGFILNDCNKLPIYTMLGYLIGDPDFKKHNIIKNEPSLNKGFLIYGDYGVGKSLLFGILRNMAIELLDQNCKNLWFSQITSANLVENFMNSAKNSASNFDIRSYHNGKLYIDDLGSEKLAFGNTDVVAELLFERNRNNAITFATSNNSPIQLQERYGNRIADRLPEMFNIISWKGESYRK